MKMTGFDGSEASRGVVTSRHLKGTTYVCWMGENKIFSNDERRRERKRTRKREKREKRERGMKGRAEKII